MYQSRIPPISVGHKILFNDCFYNKNIADSEVEINAPNMNYWCNLKAYIAYRPILYCRLVGLVETLL